MDLAKSVVEIECVTWLDDTRYDARQIVRHGEGVLGEV
jgi:hypothetical protein